MYASRMFHSLGIVQSKTWVPVGISWTETGTCFCRALKLRRSPSPVMLRQNGYNSDTSSNTSCPITSVFGFCKTAPKVSVMELRKRVLNKFSLGRPGVETPSSTADRRSAATQGQYQNRGQEKVDAFMSKAARRSLFPRYWIPPSAI